MGNTAQMYLKARELGRRHSPGQTMTEYALILGAIAVVVFITYLALGQNIGGGVILIDKALTAT